jgi:hypothetical protein
MVELQAGVTFAIEHINDQSCQMPYLESRARFDTCDSLLEYPGGEGMVSILDEIALLVYGDPAHGDKHLCASGELARNKRSSPFNPKKPFDMSASLGYTSEERGIGLVGHAQQSGSPRFHYRIERILTCCGTFCRKLAEITILPFELQQWEFASAANNAAAFGTSGMWSNIQLNHSTGVTNLAEAIGKVQGQIHTDPKDWVGGYTVFLLFVKFPKCLSGFNPFSIGLTCLSFTDTKINAGAFMFAQTGVYLQDDEHVGRQPNCPEVGMDFRCFAAVFKGNEPHCGFAPSLHPGEGAKFYSSNDLVDPGSELHNIEIINRTGLVCYISHKAIERGDSRMANFPSSGMFGSTVDVDVGNRKSASRYSATDHLIVAPDRSTHIRWHARELAYAMNMFATSFAVQLNPALLSQLFSEALIMDENHEWSALTEPSLDLHINGTRLPHDPFTKSSGELQWYIERCEASNLHVRRNVLKKDQNDTSIPFSPEAASIFEAIRTAYITSSNSYSGEGGRLAVEEIISVRWRSSDRKVILPITSSKLTQILSPRSSTQLRLKAIQRMVSVNL